MLQDSAEDFIDVNQNGDWDEGVDFYSHTLGDLTYFDSIGIAEHL